MSLRVETDYRRRLYDHYLSTHFGSLHTPSLAMLEWERRVWRDYFGPLLPADKAARMADLGCGYGSFLYFLRKAGYRDAQGVDVSREQVEAARSLGVDNVFLGDCWEFLESRPDEFDCLTAIDLLEHFSKEEVLALLQAIRRSLRPGGLLLLRVPNADGPFGAKILYSDFTHETAFTPTSIRQVLAATGFERIAVRAEGPRVHGFASAARWVAWKLISASLLLCLAAETGRIRGHILTQNLIAAARKPQPPAGNPHVLNTERKEGCES